MSSYIAAYDISHPSTRRKVARILLEYGIRIQKSVFQVQLDSREIGTLQRHVGALLSARDYFDLVPIDRDQQRHRLRWQRPSWRAAVLIY